MKSAHEYLRDVVTGQLLVCDVPMAKKAFKDAIDELLEKPVKHNESFRQVMNEVKQYENALSTLG